MNKECKPRLGRTAVPLAATMLCIVLSACATPEQPTAFKQSEWQANHSVDEFTDAKSCRVTPRAARINALLNPYVGQFYPFVEKRAGQLRVGLISGGNIRLPAGRVQLRVDDGEAWTIETSETPLDSQSATPEGMVEMMRQASPKGLTPQAEQAYRASATAVATNMNQAMSPYTAATGEKAEQMLRQMRSGHEVIYRQLGANAGNSTTGRMRLGDDFNEALTQCGL